MVLYPIWLSQSWPTTVPNYMLVSRIAQSGQNLALSRLAIASDDLLSSDNVYANSRDQGPDAHSTHHFAVFLSKTLHPLLSTGLTQKDRKLSQHD